MSEATRQEWQRRVLLAMRVMEARLDEAISLEELARAAHFSPYHFHRIFTGMTGETVGACLRRLRLARAAHRLVYSRKSVTRVALEAGFEAPDAFARAFKAAYGLSPSAWRRQHRAGGPMPGVMDLLPPIQTRLTMELNVVVKRLPPLRVAWVRHVGPYDQCHEAWDKLCALAGRHGLFGPDTQVLGIGHDDPAITPSAKIRYDACVTVPESFAGTDELPVAVIGAGEYATALIKGPYSQLGPAYAWLCGVWGPDSGREFGGAPGLEFYRNNPRNTPQDELLTEICLPLKAL